MALPEEKWLELGNAHRVLRVAAGESTAKTAFRRGVSEKELVDMEHGRADPTPLLEPFWALSDATA